MERSVLYNLAPIGIGTPFVESLTSYITRLAEAHCVYTGSIISKIYSPRLNKEYLTKISTRGGNGFFDSAIGINGIGKLACEFSELTNELTGRSDLSRTTLRNWSSILPSRGLLKKTKSWCPMCFEDSRLRNEVLYEPLVWSIQNVLLCLKHKVPLENICRNCNRTVPIINRNSFMGFCSRCEHWLGSLSSHSESIHNVNELITDVLLIGELLETNHFEVTRESLIESINFYVNESFNASSNRASKHLNIPKSTINTWITGESIPSIQYLLQLCKSLGISIIEFLQKEKEAKDVNVTVGSMQLKERLNHDVIKNMLREIIAKKDPLSISSIARVIGCDRKLLSRMYKDECDQVKEIYNAHLKAKKEQNEFVKSSKLEEAFRALTNQGIYPSRRQVEGLLGEGFLKEKALQLKWNNLKRSYQHDI